MRISIVTPSFNQGRFIEETISSVLEQRYQDLEYIVMDGGSTDGTQAILERYATHFAHVQSGPDGGQTEALAAGFARANGDVLAWLNSDDVYEPGTLDEVAEFFARRPEAQFVFGDSTWIDAGGTILRRKREIPFKRDLWLRTYNYIPQPSTFWRRDLYLAAGGLDPAFSLAMDTDLWARFSDMTTLHHVRRYWSRMRVHEDQRNTRLRARSDEEDAIIRRRYQLPEGARGRVERAAAKAVRIGWRAASGSYWG
jgi:glycosyltransferase involved in cell wall biosynthesis